MDRKVVLAAIALALTGAAVYASRAEQPRR